jgi:Tfp pilus assembly protein PilF
MASTTDTSHLDSTGNAAAPTTGPAPDMAALVAEGTSCLENGDLRGALASFEQVVAAFPDRPEGHNNLGALYTSLGEHERAEACFNQVMKILPDNPSIYYNRGMARSSQEKFDLARRDFLKVLEHDSRDTDCLNNLGVMDFMQGKLQDARQRFRQALEIKPDYARALLNLCDVEVAEGHHNRAVTLCEDFLGTYSSTEVRRALLDLLSSGCTQALEKAGATMENIMARGEEDPEFQKRLQRIHQAKAVLEENAAI